MHVHSECAARHFDVCAVAHFLDALWRRGRSNPTLEWIFVFFPALVLLTESESEACLLSFEPRPAARKHVFPFKPLQKLRVASMSTVHFSFCFIFHVVFLRVALPRYRVLLPLFVSIFNDSDIVS